MTNAHPRTTNGSVTRQANPTAVWNATLANVLSPSPISWASDWLSGPRGMLQSHAMVKVPPIAAAHHVSTMLKVATASGKIRMPCAASSQLCV